MPNIKLFLILCFTVINLNAYMLDDIVYVEDKDSNTLILKDEFIKNDSSFYTLSIAKLKHDEYDPIEFFKKYKMKNALAYKYGKNKEFVRIISGVYKTGTEATNDITNLDKRLQRHKPYSTKLFRHQSWYQEDSGLIKINPKKIMLKKTNKIKIKESTNSIFINDTKEAKELKQEFLNSNSNSYSIALGTIPFNDKSIKNFFNKYDIADKTLIHVYGKKKNQLRVIYGVYSSRSDALSALNKFNSKLKANNPFPMQMNKFQSFYRKSYPLMEENSNIIELKVKDKKSDETALLPKLSDDIKIVKIKENLPVSLNIKNIIPKVTKKEKKKIIVKKVVKKILKKEKIKKVYKKVIKKTISKTKYKVNNNKFLKNTELKDVYYLENKGSFNILTEVFLNNGSSFYTIDLGELNLNKISIEEFFINNGMNDNALAYKYGDNKEFARAIYGAYENKNDANKAIKALDIKNLRVSNIKNHQKLYKEFHKNIPQSKINTTKNRSAFSNKNSDSLIVFTNDNRGTNLLKDEFFNRDSSSYTITLITFLQKDIDVEGFFQTHNLTNNSIAYPIGSINKYYRVIYGLYSSFNEAQEDLKNLNSELRMNQPFISRIRTNQRKFESYNSRILENEISRLKKIQFE